MNARIARLCFAVMTCVSSSTSRNGLRSSSSVARRGRTTSSILGVRRDSSSSSCPAADPMRSRAAAMLVSSATGRCRCDPDAPSPQPLDPVGSTRRRESTSRSPLAHRSAPIDCAARSPATKQGAFAARRRAAGAERGASTRSAAARDSGRESWPRRQSRVSWVGRLHRWSGRDRQNINLCGRCCIGRPRRTVAAISPTPSRRSRKDGCADAHRGPRLGPSRDLPDARRHRQRWLGLRSSTAKTHVQNIYRKLGANTRAQAVERAESAGSIRDSRLVP